MNWEIVLRLKLYSCTLMAGLLIHDSTTAAAAGSENRMDRYNVVWNTPSKDATGVMPLGNGDIAAGVYAIENGDLYLLLAKNDAYTYMGDIFKTGRVRITLNPNPFRTGKPFLQTLNIATGSILIRADGVNLRIWADANRPVFHVEITSPDKVAVTVQPDLWKRIDHNISNVRKLYTIAIEDWKPSLEPTQDVWLERGGKILWYFPVGDRSTYSDDLKFYNVESMSLMFPDPFRFNTFGNLLESPQLSPIGGTLTGKGKTFDIRIHALTMQTPEPSKSFDSLWHRRVVAAYSQNSMEDFSLSS